MNMKTYQNGPGGRASTEICPALVIRGVGSLDIVLLNGLQWTGCWLRCGASLQQPRQVLMANAEQVLSWA